MRRETGIGLAAVLAACVVCTGGCMEGAMSRHKGDIKLVEVGWHMDKVVNTIGRPEYVLYGEGLKAGWAEWVYETGSVWIYRMQVQNVLERSACTPKPDKPKDEIMEGFVGDTTSFEREAQEKNKNKEKKQKSEWE